MFFWNEILTPMKTFAFLIALSMVVTQPIENQKESVSFTMKNNTATSIPLIIPGVMNPNLSPFSSSGVTVKLGQEFYYLPKGRKPGKRLLFIASEEMDGQNIVVNELIQQKKKEERDL